MLLVGQQRRYVKHNFDSTPICINGVMTGQVVNGVQATFVLVEALESHPIAEYLQELLEQEGIVIVVEYLLLGVLSLFNVNHAHLELALDKHLIQLQQLLGRVGQLTEYQRRIDVHLFTQALDYSLAIVPLRKKKSNFTKILDKNNFFFF